MKNLLCIFLTFSAIFISCTENDKVPPIVGNLEGIILNEFGQPVEDATITVPKNVTTSDYSGMYSFKNLPVGNLEVSVSKEFFITKIQKVLIVENEKSKLDFTLIAGISYLNISDSVETVSSYAGSQEILIESNADWSVRSSSLSVISSTPSGKGDGRVMITWTANNENIDKSDTIEFISGTIIKHFVLKRVAPITLVRSEGLIGNNVKGISDSIYVLFNKPIEVLSIAANNSNCTSPIKYEQVDNQCGIKFTYDCAKLGGNYSFTASVKDLYGFTKKETFEIPFYKSKLHFDGYLSNYLIINNEREILIATYCPSRILRYSIEKDSVTQIYDLSELITPYRIAYNPYNSKVYISGGTPGISSSSFAPDLPFYYTLDIRTGEIVRSAIIQAKVNYHHTYIEDKPILFGFTKAGFGIVHFGNHWEIMDCTNNDSLYIYPNGDYDFNETTLLWNMYPNHDSTKLWITRQDQYCRNIIFDGNTQSFSFVSSPYMTRSVFITPNRTNDNVFIGQLYAQFIMDSSGNMLGEMSYNGGGYLGGADFTYRGDNENLIYSISEDYLELLDHSKAETLVRFDKLYGIIGLTTTLDGQYLISCKGSGGNSAYIYIFETKYFY
jgi:hypothetical protein